MITIAAAAQPGIQISGTADVTSAGTVPSGAVSSGTVSSGTGASSFLAQFAQALSTQGAAKGGKAESQIASLIAAIGQVAPQTPSGGKGESKSDSVSSQDPTGSALVQSLAIPAIVAMATGTASKSASVDTGHADESAVVAQTGGKGKNLPNLLASIAGQEGASSNQDQSATQTEGASHAPSQTLSHFLSQALSQSSSKAQSSSKTQPQSSPKAPSQSSSKAPSQSLFQALHQSSSQSLPQSSSQALDQSKQASRFVQVLTAGTSASTPASTGQSDPSQAQNSSQVPVDASTSSLAVPIAVHATTQHVASVSTPSGNVMNMHSSFGSSNWAQELGDKMTWMAGNQGHTSELVLNPPSLGTVEVRLHVNGANAGAQFFAANVDVRNAIEAAMPKLREMMAGAGLVLGEAMVSNQSFSQRDSSQRQPQNTSSGGSRSYGSSSVIGAVSALGSGSSTHLSLGAGNSLLDYYA